MIIRSNLCERYFCWDISLFTLIPDVLDARGGSNVAVVSAMDPSQ